MLIYSVGGMECLACEGDMEIRLERKCHSFPYIPFPYIPCKGKALNQTFGRTNIWLRIQMQKNKIKSFIGIKCPICMNLPKPGKYYATFPTSGFLVPESFANSQSEEFILDSLSFFATLNYITWSFPRVPDFLQGLLPPLNTWSI